MNRQSALRKLPASWCRWWYGSVEGGAASSVGGASAAVCAEYCVEGDGHVSAFLTKPVTAADYDTIRKEINAVISSAGMTFVQTMVFAALPESFAAIVRQVVKECSGVGRTPANHGPFRMWVVAPAGAPATSAEECAEPAPLPAPAPPTPSPPLYRVQSLEKKNAGVVNDAWPYKSPWSPAMVVQCIEERPSSCAINVATGELVAWAVTRNDGSIGLLHTEPEHRKQGLAKAVVADLVAKLRAEGFAEPYFYVSKGNEGSEKVCAGLGFVPMVGEGYVWLSYKT